MPDEQIPYDGRPRRLAAPAEESSDDGPRSRPGIGDVLLWGTLGCGALVVLICGVAGIGGGAWLLMTRVSQEAPVVVDPDQAEEEAESEDPGIPSVLPAPPLSLVVPVPPASKFGETDLTEWNPRDLRGAANQLYGQRRYRPAVQFQYQSVVKDQNGQYNLACYYARAGDLPAALYWLQDSAREEGVDADHASRDEDLIEVRKDPRWPKLRTYLRACQRYWEKSGYSETSLVLPKNAVPGNPIPVFVGLHGFGSNAHEFIDVQDNQALADSMGAAFLGVSGTRCRGRRTFVWSEDAAQDLARVDAALKEVADRLTPAEGQVVLYGFSQGAMVAGELAARHPQRFAGAILLSPGSVSRVDPFQLPQLPEGRRLGLVAVCGAGEHPTTVSCTNGYAAAYRSRSARVYLKIYAGMNHHTFPPDFAEKFPIWGKFILDPAAKVPE